MKCFLQIVVFTILLLNANKAFSQIDNSYKWTWIGGDNTVNSYGVYGQKGIESPLNKPGARGYCSNWTDAQGNLWLFGGQGFAATTSGDLNDLWKYNISTNEWTWMAGDSVANAPAFFGGVLGVEGKDFTPDAREAASAWVDAMGTQLYLFAGYTPSKGWIFHSDVWSFNTTTNYWQCVKGTLVDSVGNCKGLVYGAPGEFSRDISPVCRAGVTATAFGNIAYAFGGFTYAGVNFNDLYDFADEQSASGANEWAYLDYSLTFNSLGNYTNAPHPGSRYNAMSFIGGYGSYGPIYYLFGGSGYGNSQYGQLNDLWRFDGLDPITHKAIWSWIKGDSSVNSSGKYGSLGSTDNMNAPAARGYGSIVSEGNEKYILFGGGSGGYIFNDVWIYDINGNTWTWISGSNLVNSGNYFTLGNYGVKGVQQPYNLIGSRTGHACWITSNGDMYVFGGGTPYGKSNDLWKFSKPQDLVTIDAISGNIFYPGGQFQVSYTIHPQAFNPFASFNYFYVQLSDANGNFATPAYIGNLMSTNSGTITVFIPYVSIVGTNYKVRIISSNVAYTSPAFPQPITVNPNPIVAAKAQVEFANREFTTNDGWTNYYNDTLLLLSLQKNGNNIGSIGDGTFAVECAATQFAGSGTGVHVTNPLVTNTSGYWTMNRFWTVKPTHEPSTPVGVRFYFNDADIQDVKASVPTVKSVTDLQFYKTIGGNPDPISNWAGATSVIPLLNGNAPSDTSWTYQLYNNGMHRAEFTVSSFSGGGGGGTQDGQVLPVQLTAFTVTLQNTNAIVKWQTATEVNTSYFTIQRSLNGVDFSAIEKVTVAGNSNSGNDYICYDKAINNLTVKTVFYRLQITDKDGNVSYSKVVAVQVLQRHLFALLPNPAKEEITVHGEELLSVKIYDVNGKLLISRSNIQSVNVTISVNNFNKGVYIVQIEDKNRNKETKKMIVE